MFNKISDNVYTDICNMLFEHHNLMISGYKELNRLFNSSYCSKVIKEDILDILQQNIYVSEINLAQMGF